MGNKNKRLQDLITSPENIELAYSKAIKDGKKYKEKHLEFQEDLYVNLEELRKELIEGSYTRGVYTVFSVVEVGKRRIIYALSFRDCVVQHAVNNIIEPIFDRTFYSSSYACRKGKGEHLAARHVQAAIRRVEKQGEVFYLKMDFKKYFASIPGFKLLREIRRKIRCKWTIRIMCQFITETGIRIGNLLSQLFANIYGHVFDRFIKTKLRIKNYFRYMDDTVILSTDKAQLYKIKDTLEKFAGLFMGLKFSKWQISAVEEKSLNYLGYRIRAGYKLVRRDSVKRAKRTIKLYKNTGEEGKLKLFLASWLGHVGHADSHNLKTYIHQELLAA